MGFPGDSSGSVEGGSGSSIDLDKILREVKAAQGLFGGHGRGSGDAAQREMARVMREMLKLQRQQALLARKQWQFQLDAAYPGGPGSLVPVETWDLPTKLTSKLTKVQQARMTHPNRLSLRQKEAKLTRKIDKFKANHPEAANLRLARSS